MIPGFDFSDVINQLTYPGSPVAVWDVPGSYEHGRWVWDWASKEVRSVVGIALFGKSEENQIDQTGNYDDAQANLMTQGNVPMYIPGMSQFAHPSGGQFQSFWWIGDKAYRVMNYDFLWDNTNCRSWNGQLFTEVEHI